MPFHLVAVASHSRPRAACRRPSALRGKRLELPHARPADDHVEHPAEPPEDALLPVGDCVLLAERPHLRLDQVVMPRRHGRWGHTAHQPPTIWLIDAKVPLAGLAFMAGNVVKSIMG